MYGQSLIPDMYMHTCKQAAYWHIPVLETCGPLCVEDNLSVFSGGIFPVD